MRYDTTTSQKHPRQAKRAFRMLILWNIRPPGRKRLIAFCLQSGNKIANVLIQLLSIFLPAYAINATGSIPVETKVTFLQEPFVQQMSQTHKLKFRVPASPFRYEGQSLGLSDRNFGRVVGLGHANRTAYCAIIEAVACRSAQVKCMWEIPGVTISAEPTTILRNKSAGPSVYTAYLGREPPGVGSPPEPDMRKLGCERSWRCRREHSQS